LEPQERKVVLLGNKREVKGYNLRGSEIGKIVLSRDATFDQASIIVSEFSAGVEWTDQRDITGSGE